MSQSKPNTGHFNLNIKNNKIKTNKMNRTKPNTGLGDGFKSIGISFALIATILIFGSLNVSAGGCCCYADSCLNEINSSASVSSTQAYLSVTKFVDKNIAQVGDEIGYTIVVQNLGNDTAYHVTVDDVLPTDIAVVNEGSQGVIYNRNKNGNVQCDFSMNLNNETGKILTCTIEKIPKKGETGSNVTIYFKAKVQSHTNAPACHTNNVSVNGFYSQCQPAEGEINKTFDGCPCDSIDICNQVYGVSDIATLQSDKTVLNDSATVCIAGINVVKTRIGDGIVVPGTVLNYSINVTNTGDIGLSNIVINDTLPEGCDNLTQTNFILNYLAPGQSNVIYVACRVRSDFNGPSLTNSVKVTGTNGTVNVTNTDTSTVVFAGKPEAKMTKTALNPYAHPGDIIQYEISVNTGSQTAYNVTINDALPSGFTFNNNIWQNCNNNGYSITYNNGTFTLGNVTGACIFRYSVKIGNNVPDGIYRNNATMNANYGDGTPMGEAKDHSDVYVVHDSKLTVNKEVNEFKIYQAGEIIHYTLHVCNYGQTPVWNVNVRDIVPYGYNLSASWDEDTGTIYEINNSAPMNDTVMHTEGDYNYTNSSIGYNLYWHKDVLNNKTCWNIGVNFTVTSSAISSINKVEVNGTDPNGDTLIWKDSAPSVVIGKALVDLEKFVDTATVAPGQDVWYTIYIRNKGIGDAINLTVVDDPDTAIQDSNDVKGLECNGIELSPASNYIEVAPANPGYGEKVTYKIVNVSLQSGKFCKFKYRAHVDPMALQKTYTNIATLYANDTSGTPLPEVKASAYVQVLQTGQATITKTIVGGEERVSVCDNVTFNITIENNADQELREIVINDTIPDGLIFLNATPSASGNSSTHVWWINPFNVSPNSSKSILVTFKVNCSATGGLNSNKVTFTSRLAGGTPIDGNAEKIFEITKPRLTIQKMATPPQANAGDTVRYIIEVRNWEMGVARNVYVIDERDNTKFRYNGGSLAVVAGSCTVSTPDNGHTFIINNGGNFSGYEGCIFSYTTTVQSTGCAGNYTNNATLHYSYGTCGCDEETVNSSASVEVLVNMALMISKSANDTNLYPGKDVNFTLTVTNTGTETVTGGTVIDQLPYGFTFIDSGGDHDVLMDGKLK